MLPKTVILHYKKLRERKSNVINQLNKFNFTDYIFYEDFDQNELTNDIIKNLYESKLVNPDLWTSKVSIWGSDALRYHNPILNLAEISITIKFGKVFQQLTQEKFDYCIVFEDDIILCDDFTNKFNNYLCRTPDDWDAIYFGCCVNLHPKNPTPEKVAYLKNHPSSRGGDSTIFKHQTVVDLANTWFPFNLVSDWELAAQHHIHDHKVYWWEPSLTKQGSETGLFKSTLR